MISVSLMVRVFVPERYFSIVRHFALKLLKLLIVFGRIYVFATELISPV